jgi:hypothetical protein
MGRSVRDRRRRLRRVLSGPPLRKGCGRFSTAGRSSPSATPGPVRHCPSGRARARRSERGPARRMPNTISMAFEAHAARSVQFSRSPLLLGQLATRAGAARGVPARSETWPDEASASLARTATTFPAKKCPRLTGGLTPPSRDPIVN